MKFKALRLGVVIVLGFALVGCSASDESSKSARPFGDCVVTKDPPVHELKTVSPGKLTLAASFPYPEGYRGDTLATVDGGYMYCLGAEIAKRGGVSGIKLKNASFETLVTAKTSDFDVAIWDIYDTPERRKVVDFATPYNKYEAGVLVRADSDVTKANVADAKVGILTGAKEYREYLKRVVGVRDLKAFGSNDDMYNALLAKQVDVVMNDVPIVMPAAKKSNGRLKVVARYRGIAGDPAPLLPKNSGNLEAVNAIMDDMIADGSLDKIMRKWLDPLLGGNPHDLPAW